jgi:iron complex transport system ATP-binding protein
MVTLHIKGISFSYNSHSVLRDISVEIAPGEVVAIVGKNGAGKSTLLKCINHILSASTGNILVDTLDVGGLHERERARTFAYLSQKNEYVFPLTVFDVVLAGRYPHSPLRFTRHDEQVVAETLAIMGLGGFAQRSFDHLSGGEQQQVLIARALAQRAEVLLFDEPTSSLDLRHQLEIMRLIRHIAHEKSIASIIAIHDLNLAAAFADTIMVMHNGKIHAVGKPADVLTVQTLKHVFEVDAKIYDHGGVPHIVLIEKTFG